MIQINDCEFNKIVRNIGGGSAFEISSFGNILVKDSKFLNSFSPLDGAFKLRYGIQVKF